MTIAASISECLDFAVQAARKAGAVIMPYFQGKLHVETKKDGSPVTLADRGAEEELRRLIRERFPDDAVLGEEFGELPGCSGRRWILDPIDGTKAFVYGVPLFGVLVGLEENDVPVLGVVYLPALEEMVYAARGRGCWWLPAGRPPGSLPRSARVTAVISLAESLVLTNSYEYFAKTGRTAACERLHQSARYSRGWADCYGHILVATGRAEVCVDPQMNIWDGAPLLPILTEAGGTFTDWKGQPTIRGGDGISTNGRVLAEVLRVLG